MLALEAQRQCGAHLLSDPGHALQVAARRSDTERGQPDAWQDVSKVASNATKMHRNLIRRVAGEHVEEQATGCITWHLQGRLHGHIPRLLGSSRYRALKRAETRANRSPKTWEIAGSGHVSALVFDET